MSKNTIRQALGLPKREERVSQVFVLTREQVASAFADQREAFETRGYHTWKYWRSTTEGEAALGEALQDILEQVNPALFDALYDAAGDEGKTHE